VIAAHWGVELHASAPLDPYDYWATRDRRTVAIFELKNRGHAHGARDCDWMDVHKWSTLTELSLAFQVPALWVVTWSDGPIGWLNVAHVDTRRHTVVGRQDRGPGERRWAIRLPLETFHPLERG
jgi:phospholipase C